MIQIVFTPAVQWTFLVGLCYTPRVSKSPADLEINGHPLVSLNGAFVLIALYCTYYIYLDRLFGTYEDGSRYQKHTKGDRGKSQ